MKVQNVLYDTFNRRVAGLIDKSNVAIGGDVDESNKFISPTVVTDVKPDDAIMQEEVMVTVFSLRLAYQLIKITNQSLCIYQDIWTCITYCHHG